MFARRTDLPLERDALGRFLPWLIAFMVFLATLALAGVLVLGAMVERWDRGVAGTLTVQMPPRQGADTTARVQEVVDLLLQTQGVVAASRIPGDRVLALLEPWLGPEAVADDLPLPILIDVELRPGAEVDMDALSTRLAATAPGATVDDHRVWLDRLVRLVRLVEVLAGAVLVLIGLACVGTVVFTTRTGLAIHHEAIEVLHLIGAQDTYVARQFAGRALSLGLRGGFLGLALAAPTLAAIGYMTQRLESGLLPAFSLSALDWAALALLPLLVAAIAMLTARYTVLGTLARMP